MPMAAYSEAKDERLALLLRSLFDVHAVSRLRDFRQTFHRNFQDPVSRRSDREPRWSLQVGLVAFQTALVVLRLGLFFICVPPSDIHASWLHYMVVPNTCQ